MVAHFMGDDISLCKITRRSETVAQVFEEGEVEVDPLVTRTIERADGRARGPACGLDLTCEQDKVWLLVSRALFLEQASPDFLGVSEDNGDEFLLFLNCGGSLNRPFRVPRVLQIGELGRIAAEEKVKNKNDDCTKSAPEGETGPSHAATVFNV